MVKLPKVSPKWLAVAVLALPLYFVQGKLVVITSDSIDHRFLVKTEGVPQKDEYALFRISHELTDDESVTLTKRLACYAGDLLQVKNRDFYCEGHYLGRAKVTSRQGVPLTPFVYNGAIPDGYAFAIGEHQDSFDSRYWGLLELAVAERVVPLLQ